MSVFTELPTRLLERRQLALSFLRPYIPELLGEISLDLGNECLEARIRSSIVS